MLREFNCRWFDKEGLGRRPIIAWAASGFTFAFDLENFVTSAGASITYVVDAQGRRVKKTVSGTMTEYFYSGAVVIAEKQGSNWTDYLFFNGQRIVKQTGSTLSTASFFHSDHVNSTRLCTNSSGNSNGVCDYEPFGEVQPGSSCTVPTNYRFAGMELDPDTGLYHTWFREYNSNTGRWAGVDPLAGDQTDSQTLNRYVYVRNDPINLMDPFGLEVFCMAFVRIRVTETWNEDTLSWEITDITILGIFTVCSGSSAVGGGGGPGLPGFSKEAHERCAKQAFGGTTGNIPGTDRSIPGFEASLAVFQASILVGVDPSTVGITMAYESDSGNQNQTGGNSDGTRDVGPMQLNTYWASTGAFSHIYPNSFGTNTLPRQPFNGNFLSNVMTGARYLRDLGSRPERYAAPTYQSGRRQSLNPQGKLFKMFRAFFNCLAGSTLPGV